MNVVKLSREQQSAFEHILMVGILKTLKDDGSLSDSQLYSALSKLKIPNAI